MKRRPKPKRRKGVYVAAMSSGDPRTYRRPESEVERITYDLLGTDRVMVPIEIRKSILK